MAAASEMKNLTQDRNIIAHILNEEAHQSSSSNSSLNAAQAAPIKSSGKKKKDHADLKCHYCNKKGHIKPECCKKKKDEAEKKKKEEVSSSGNKAANSHVQVPSIIEIDDNDNISVSLYAADKIHWMMDSGATHHITPHRSDFTDYTPIRGTIHLRDKSTTDQVGIGSVIFRSPQGHKITLRNVLHVPSVHTHFLSTSMMMNKEAMITFDQGGFEISIDQKCVAKGYQEDKLYWLDTLNISLNAHTGGAVASLHTWIFGCKAYMHVPADKHRKLDAKAIEVMFIGYKPRSKGYRLWDKCTHSVQLSRDVTFDKSSLPSSSGNEPHPESTLPLILAITVPNTTAMPPQ